MNLLPKHFTSLALALDYCDLIGKCSIYQFGSLYNVYMPGTSTPATANLIWESK